MYLFKLNWTCNKDGLLHQAKRFKYIVQKNLSKTWDTSPNVGTFKTCEEAKLALEYEFSDHLEELGEIYSNRRYC